MRRCLPLYFTRVLLLQPSPHTVSSHLKCLAFICYCRPSLTDMQDPRGAPPPWETFADLRLTKKNRASDSNIRAIERPIIIEETTEFAILHLLEGRLKRSHAKLPLFRAMPWE